MKHDLQTLVTQAFAHVAASWQCELPPDFLAGLDESKSPEHGDYATNAALALAKPLRRAPRQIAEAVVARLRETDSAGLFERIEVAGPGFINLTLTFAEVRRQLRRILAEGRSYGRQALNPSLHTLIEFVSANPTGPLNVVNGRAASLGDSLARIFEYTGIPAETEFYINDAGNQVRLFGLSLKAHMAALHGEELPFPEEGYQGEYVRDLAAEWLVELTAAGRDWRSLRDEEYSAYGIGRMVALQQADLERFRVRFTTWYSEQRGLHATGKVQATLEMLQARGEVYSAEGALWLRTSSYGDDKDRILVKSDGVPTYFLADIAYHIDKYQRHQPQHPTRVVNIWGPDHHGHVVRMKAAMQACGLDPENLIILIAQMVRLKEGGEMRKFSKRKGEFYTLTELMDETSVDTARYFFVSRRFDSHLDFDIALAREISSQNPVYYIQYAHARICSILRGSENEDGISAAEVSQTPAATLERLTDPLERDLILNLLRFPQTVEAAARSFEPHVICYALTEYARAFHNYYKHVKVRNPEDRELTLARLALIAGLRNMLALGLDLLGIDAPERM